MLVKIYNLISFLGWILVMIMNQNLLLLQIVQSLAIFDVVLALLEIIRTNYLISFIQILSRCFIVWGPLYISIEMPRFVLRFLTLTWGLSDSVRYLYYYNPNIPILKFLRYNLFWFLYPIGIAFEILSCYYSPLKSIIIPVILIYLIFGFQLYYHMIIQNSKKN
jgi:very-long-chain (3R)-3-hydroxyacyl-CoA dehydratase